MTWLDPENCPAERPSPSSELHDALDAHAREAGVPWLHPTDPTLMLDLLGSKQMIAWQDAKATHHFLGEGSWSELPQVYGRYGTQAGHALIQRVKALESAGSAVLTDCGMQATALTFDALLTPGAHAICCRQVYNKSRTYLQRLAERIGATVTIVDDGDLDALSAALQPETAFVFCETFTNPLVRAQDLDALVALLRDTPTKLIVDNTIATPWAVQVLEGGADVVLASGTKALAGQDRDMWGYVASNDMHVMNGVMDLQALRGGALDWRRATAILAGLDLAEERHGRRCASAERVAAFLAAHPRVSEVFHPSVPGHPDAPEQYSRHGSLLSFRVEGADEDATRHFADVLATFRIVRYALSFDGLVTKVNHHQTVSEYFTPPPVLRKLGFDRLVRLAVGLERADDLIACLNWTLWHGDSVSVEEIDSWQAHRWDS